MTLEIDYGTSGDNKFFASEKWQDLRQRVLLRDGNQCGACQKLVNLTVHHIKPRSEGGSDAMRNLTTLCTKCHDRLELGEDIYEVEVKPEAGGDWHTWVYGGARQPA